MLVGALGAYGRRAYAACINVGGSNFQCSNPSTAQSISAANATVTTLAGFSITTASSNALSITGSGDLSYTDPNFSPLTATSGNGLNITTTASVPGSITINTNGAVTARNYGIRGRNQGTGALNITVNGDVTSTGTTLLSRGIIALNFGTNLTVTTGAGADISGARYGILSRNYGTGSTTVTVNGNVTASGTTGLDTGLLARGNAAVTVTTAAGTTVSGQENGIFARSDGSGPVTITVNGDVTGTADDGIYASSGAGGIAITVGSASHVTSNGTASDDFAIDTSTFATSATSLTVAGTLNGGAGGAVRFGSLADRLELQPTAVINGIVFAGAGTDTFALGGAGTASFDVSKIGPTAQYRDFEVFEKDGASHWTLTGTNTTLPNFTVNSGLLTVAGALPNTPFTVNSASLELTGGGSIGSVNIADAAGVFDISATTAGATITTLSSVANSSVALGAKTLTLSNASGTFNGVIGGSGGLALDAGIETLTGVNTYTGSTTVDGGTLLVDGSIASSSAVTVNAGGVLGGDGTVGPLTVMSGGLLAPGNPVGTLTINGNLTLNPGAVLNMQLNGPLPSDMLTVNGNVKLTGSILDLLIGPAQVTPATTYLLIQNDGADPVQGTFASVSLNLPFLTPFVIYNAGTGNDVTVTLLRNDVDWCFIAATANQCSVITALEKFPTDNPLLLAMVTQTADGARQAADALSGEVHATLSGVLMDDSRYVRDAVFGRLRQASYAGASSEPTVGLGAGGPTTVAALDTSGRMALGGGDDAAAIPAYGHGLTFWTRGFGSWGTFSGDGNAATAQRNLSGFVSGMDANIGDGWRAGLATGYMQSNINVDARASSADLESYVLAGYAGGSLGPIALRSGSAWTWHSVETSRSVIFPGFFEAENATYNAGTGQVFGEAAYPLLLHHAAVEPFADIAYVHVGTGSFTESGALAALTASGNDEDVGYSLLGVRVAMTFPVAGIMVMPHGSVAWQYAFGDITPAQTFAFASTGIALGISGVPIAQNSALIDAGLDIVISPDATLGLSYAGQLAGNLQDNGIEGRVKWRF